MYILNYIKEHFADNVHDIEIWTDGPSSQFKNKYFCVYWHHLASVDSIRGVLKLFSKKPWRRRCRWCWWYNWKWLSKMRFQCSKQSMRKQSRTLLPWPRNIKSPHSEILVFICYGKTSTHCLARCTFTVLSKQTREKFLPDVQQLSILYYPSPELSWVSSCWQTLGHKSQHCKLCYCEIWGYTLPWRSSSFGAKPVSNSKHSGM